MVSNAHWPLKEPMDQNTTDCQDGTAMCLDIPLFYNVSSYFLDLLDDVHVCALILPFSSFFVRSTTPHSLPLYCMRKFWTSVRMGSERQKALHWPPHIPRIWCPWLIWAMPKIPVAGFQKDLPFSLYPIHLGLRSALSLDRCPPGRKTKNDQFKADTLI